MLIGVQVPVSSISFARWNVIPFRLYVPLPLSSFTAPDNAARLLAELILNSLVVLVSDVAVNSGKALISVSAAYTAVGSRLTTRMTAISRDSARFFMSFSSFCSIRKKRLHPAHLGQPYRRKRAHYPLGVTFGSRCGQERPKRPGRSDLSPLCFVAGGASQ